jgi:hypothetical protein
MWVCRPTRHKSGRPSRFGSKRPQQTGLQGRVKNSSRPHGRTGPRRCAPPSLHRPRRWCRAPRSDEPTSLDPWARGANCTLPDASGRCRPAGRCGRSSRVCRAVARSRRGLSFGRSAAKPSAELVWAVRGVIHSEPLVLWAAAAARAEQAVASVAQATVAALLLGLALIVTAFAFLVSHLGAPSYSAHRRRAAHKLRPERVLSQDGPGGASGHAPLDTSPSG